MRSGLSACRLRAFNTSCVSSQPCRACPMAFVWRADRRAVDRTAQNGRLPRCFRTRSPRYQGHPPSPSCGGSCRRHHVTHTRRVVSVTRPPNPPTGPPRPARAQDLRWCGRRSGRRGRETNWRPGSPGGRRSPRISQRCPHCEPAYRRATGKACRLRRTSFPGGSGRRCSVSPSDRRAGARIRSRRRTPRTRRTRSPGCDVAPPRCRASR